MAIKYTLLINKKPEFILRQFQSPRGLRVNEKRPDEIIVKIDETFNYIELTKHISYLVKLASCMELNNTNPIAKK